MLAVLIVVGGVTAQAGGNRTPEQLGAQWARVSDGAEIQLIVDELCAGGRGVDGAVVVGKRVPSTVMQTLMKRKNSGGGASALSTGAAPERRVRIEGNAATVEFAGGDKLHLEKSDGMWRVTGGTVPQPSSHAASSTGLLTTSAGSGQSVGETFVETALSREHSIGRLTRRIVQNRIQRELFGTPDKTASYLSVRSQRNLPFTIVTYVQFILDPAWNRIVYGNLDKWIKTYSVTAPSAIAVDTDGTVFVGEPAKERILVLQLAGSGEAELRYHRHISGITNPTDISVSDNGTPFTTADDYIYIADASANAIFKYSGGLNANVRLAAFDGFESPSSVAVGRWNGTNTSLLYVVDKIGRRIRVFEDTGTLLREIAQYIGDHRQYFKSLKVDHFGNVYGVDNVGGKIIKFSPTLELLDSDGGEGRYAALADIDIPFGKFESDADRRYIGFNQLFAVERWDERSGAQRRTLGLKLRDIAFNAEPGFSAIRNSFLMTDVGNVTIKIIDEKTNRLVRTLTSSWMVAGEKNLLWDRRSDEGKQVPAGTYRYEVGAASAYGGEPVVSSTKFFLPLHYHADCGNANTADDPFNIQGNVVFWGRSPSQTAREDAESVRYRFTGLDPAAEYEVIAEFAARDGIRRLQTVSADGMRLHEPFRVASTPERTSPLQLPKASYADGEVTVSIDRLGDGNAIVTQLWIRQTGVGFSPSSIAEMPRTYSLQQNYPNPFNPSTTIRYALPEDAAVTLKVYNINGQEVATLVNERQTSGSYEVRFDASNGGGGRLASGVYLYQVRAGNFTETRKMVLLK